MQTLIEVNNVTRSFAINAGLFKKQRILHAVNGISLSLQKGEVLGIVGESGCGKSTFARMLLGLMPPSTGHISFNGTDLAKLDRKAMAKQVQPVFQDPFSSLNPRRTVASIVAFPLEVHGIGTTQERRKKTLEIMDMVGLPARFADRYPKELSGGQRQRVAIARALIMRPDVIICDEPTSALDVSVQSQILNLLMDLRNELNLTYVFISHNLAVVEHIATRVAVMYLGRVVELSDTARLFSDPQHPYTRALLGSVLTPVPGLPIPDTGLGLAFPDPLNPPLGCVFNPRCHLATEQCRRDQPPLIRHDGREVACFLAGQRSHISMKEMHS
ncbi:ABC transporter ATP-binding protein [Paenochrobactrum sp. BZR 588]|uniref:ABC transporter ATP-binding protein n=1 Tax=Paenochrobactrum TaxID=999488 RepID=UPI0035BC59C5